jgi:hypothetical protein
MTSEFRLDIQSSKLVIMCASLGQNCIARRIVDHCVSVTSPEHLSAIPMHAKDRCIHHHHDLRQRCQARRKPTMLGGLHNDGTQEGCFKQIIIFSAIGNLLQKVLVIQCSHLAGLTLSRQLQHRGALMTTGDLRSSKRATKNLPES